MTNNNHTCFYPIALTKIPMVGCITAKTLISYCGSAEAIFTTKKSELVKIPGIGLQIAESILQHASSALHEAEQELEYLRKHNIYAFYYVQDDYPVRFRNLPGSPIVLYYKGNDKAQLNADRTIGIIGTRTPTEYGKLLCEELVQDLQPYNVVIVSGLAFGIDVTAHRKATQCKIPNIGVLGHGLSRIYPADHSSVAQKMVENGGLLTEFTHKTGPDRENFPMRNRIIAGMCDALVVVETAESGGSIITANLASEYDRNIFAFPGRVRDPRSKGCNQLIRDKKANLIESAQDIVRALRWDKKKAQKGIQTSLFHQLNDEERRIIETIKLTPEVAIDTLSLSAGLSHGMLASHLLELEFKGLIKTLPGKRYILV